MGECCLPWIRASILNLPKYVFQMYPAKSNLLTDLKTHNLIFGFYLYIRQMILQKSTFEQVN